MRQSRRQEEYLALVEARFKAADPDNDGKLDAKELAYARGEGSCEVAEIALYA